MGPGTKEHEDSGDAFQEDLDTLYGTEDTEVDEETEDTKDGEGEGGKE